MRSRFEDHYVKGKVITSLPLHSLGVPLLPLPLVVALHPLSAVLFILGGRTLLTFGQPTFIG